MTIFEWFKYNKRELIEDLADLSRVTKEQAQDINNLLRQRDSAVEERAEALSLWEKAQSAFYTIQDENKKLKEENEKLRNEIKLIDKRNQRPRYEKNWRRKLEQQINSANPMTKPDEKA